MHFDWHPDYERAGMKRIFFCFVLSLPLLFGCGVSSTPISISALNYSDKHISDFMVNGYSGGSVGTDGGGGSFVCCVKVPTHWHTGLNATIQWADDEANPNSYKKKIIEIPNYGENDVGYFIVHFYPNDEIKILVTKRIVTHPDYPYPRPKHRNLNQ